MAVVVVTGAGRGIGAATARRLVAAGDVVVVNYARDATSANALVQNLNDGGGTAVVMQADVGDAGQVTTLFERVDREVVPAHGPLRGLVNNAGIVDVAIRVDEMDVPRLQRMFAVNVFGSFLCAREAIRRMSTRHGGRGGAIVNLTSAAARIGAPAQYVDYAAAKGAIDSFTLGLAKEVAGEGIRVNAVRPGIIDTEIHADGGDAERARRSGPSVPAGRAGTSDEVAAAIAWLLSDDASYCNGTILDVTGGR